MKNFIIIIFLWINQLALLSQQNKEIETLKKINDDPKIKKYAFARVHRNELDFILSNLFLFYKIDHISN